MDSLFDSKLTLGAAGAAAVLLGVLAVLHFGHADVGPRGAAPAQAAGAWDNPIGPGQLGGAVREAPMLGLDPQAARDPHLALDRGGHLVPDMALRTLVDSFLGKTKGAERQARAGELRAFLNVKLQAPASQDANRIVTDYLAYLDAEEPLRARERFSRPDPSGLSDAEVEHLLTFQQQRAQLRQRMLGSAVAQAWFEGEDAECANALSDWRRLRAPADSDEVDSNELQARRLHGAALEERRNLYAQGCASQIIEGLVAAR
jgi:lipase chaperone LimK